MTKQIENILINFWMNILPELDNNPSRLDEHLKKFLSIDSSQAIQNYYHYKKPTTMTFDDFGDKCIKVIENQLFSKFFQKIILISDNKLSKIIQQTSLLSHKLEFQNTIYALLYKKLFAQAYLVLVNELNFYRLNNQLKGENEEEQFEYFCSELIVSQKFLTTLENEYPMFLENLSNTVINTINYLEEIFKNTENCVRKLETCFGFEILGSLKEIEFMGDTHNNGKAVCIIHFKAGKLIYKPKSMKTERNFQNVLNFINNQINDTKLYEMKVYTNKNAGWCEFISQEKCESLEDVEKCYKRIGKLLAILYSLNGVDFHYENIIFKGEFPVLIDLETLFNVSLKDSLTSNKSAFTKASTVLKNSVLSIGLLPTKMKLNQKEAVSIGALDTAQSYEVNAPTLVNIGTSNMKVNISKKQIHTGQADILGDSSLHVAIDYVTLIKEGFTEVYQWISNNQETYIPFILELFNDCHVRIVVKPTMIYSQLLSTANHPDFLTKDIHRKVVYSRVGIITENEMIAKSEIQELEKNDIPYFFANFNSNNLYSFSNHVIYSALEDSPRANFLNKMQLLSTEDLERQIGFIHSAFFKKETIKELTPLHENHVPVTNYEVHKYKDMAIKIANQLKSEAIFGENANKQKEVVWLDTSVANMDIDDWTPEITSFDLYNGLSGLAIFFMNLDKVNGNHNKEIIDCIINNLKEYIRSISNKKENLQSGIMTGVSGMLLTIFEYAQMYASKADEDFIDETIFILQAIIAENNPIDYVSGNVGALSLMVKIIKKTHNQNLQNKCKEIADLICLDFSIRKDKLFEQKSTEGITIYSGFSHGLSGLINYLYEYYVLTNKDAIYQLFKECLDYQRSNFWSPSDLDWFISDKEEKFAYGWCHGSPGILIEKLNLKKLGFQDENIDKEILYAVKQTMDNLGSNISLCHGDLGNLLVLQQYLKVEENEQIKLFIQNATNLVYEFIDKSLESNERRTFMNFKGLLLGIAGIGDFMLKRYSEYNKQELIEYLW